MGIKYRKLKEKDLDIFIEMRINQLREEGAKEDIDLRPALRDYYMRHMKDGTFVSWIAEDEGKIIGTSGMSFVESRHTLDAQVGRWDSCPACLQIQLTGVRVLQKNYCTELSKRQRIMAVVRFRSRHLIWE